MLLTICLSPNWADKNCLRRARVNHNSCHHHHLLRCIDAELHVDVVVETEKSKGHKDWVHWEACMDSRRALHKDWAHLRRVALAARHCLESPYYCMW